MNPDQGHMPYGWSVRRTCVVVLWGASRTPGREVLVKRIVVSLFAALV